MTTRPVTRLHLFFATENDRAVILRQGPARHFRLVLWHRESDSFEDGQWMKHRVYPDRCDLSPDGRHFIYFALNGDWKGMTEGAYTALSRPPYFTALALFPEGNTWGGGGQFLDNIHYLADGGPDVIGRDDGLARLFRREPTKHCPTGLFKIDGKCAPIGQAKAETALARNQTRHPDLDRYDTQGGVLFRRDGQDLIPIRDFNDMTFEPIRAPYDWRDSGEAPADPPPWHPLDREGA